MKKFIKWLNSLFYEYTEEDYKLGIYDADSPEYNSITAYLIVDISSYCTKLDKDEVVLIKYANSIRGKIGQLWMNGKNVHYFINEMGINTLAKDETFIKECSILGANVIGLAKVILDNQ